MIHFRHHFRGLSNNRMMCAMLRRLLCGGLRLLFLLQLFAPPHGLLQVVEKLGLELHQHWRLTADFRRAQRVVSPRHVETSEYLRICLRHAERLLFLVLLFLRLFPHCNILWVLLLSRAVVVARADPFFLLGVPHRVPGCAEGVP